ncbi:MAG TPA: hypothetical protein VF785_14255 [Gemmatimonadaceae bacterium]
MIKLSTLSNSELRSLELDPATSGDMRIAVTAEMTRRQMSVGGSGGLSDLDGRRVTLVGLDIPFVNLVVLLAKVAIAAIPAMLIIAVGARVASMIAGGAFSTVLR